jgi:hypothetical protein
LFLVRPRPKRNGSRKWQPGARGPGKSPTQAVDIRSHFGSMEQIDLSLFAALPDHSSAVDPHGTVAGAGEAAGAAAGGAVAVPVAVVEQIAVPGDIVPVVGAQKQKLAFARRSVELLAHARSIVEVNREKRKACAAEARAEVSEQKLQVVAASFPSIAPLLGPVRRHRLTRDSADPVAFGGLALAAFVGLKQKIQVGVTRKRLLAAAAKLIENRQCRGLSLMLLNARVFKLAIGPDPRQQICIAYTHEWDESRAMFRRWALPREGLRGCLSAAPVNVMVQRGAIHTRFSIGFAT